MSAFSYNAFKKINSQSRLHQILPANSKVSVAWQIVFTFLPIVNFWAFYRIRKLRKYLLFVFAPSVALSIMLYAYILSNPLPSLMTRGEDDPAFGVLPYSDSQFSASIIGNVAGFGLQGLSIYLVIIWSRLHNRRVDASTGQAPLT